MDNYEPWYMYYLRQSPIHFKYYEGKQRLLEEYSYKTQRDSALSHATESIMEEINKWIKLKMK